MPRQMFFSAVVLVSLAGCAGGGETLTPSFELVDETERLDASLVNAHVYGTFAITFGDPGGVITSGPANFPGSPPGGPGTCVNGLWYNSKGKATAGTLDQPHPHCVAGSSAIQVVLEPISASVPNPSKPCDETRACDFLILADSKTGQLSVIEAQRRDAAALMTVGTGTVYAYAIDAASLGAGNRRVGAIKFSLDEYDDPTQSLFGTCSLTEGDFACLPRVITAKYYPLDAGGVGTEMLVTGFLWWAPATAPYNY